jgi:hypothetical protein
MSDIPNLPSDIGDQLNDLDRQEGGGAPAGEHRPRNAVETAANIAIIVVASVATIVMIRSSVFDGNLRQAPKETTIATRTARHISAPEPGTTLSLPQVDWTRSKNTLVLALAKGCRFCEQSAPFYRRLAGELAGRQDVRLVAVFAHETQGEAKEYLDSLGVPVAEIEQAPLHAIGARGTPTLILADNTGKVMESWIGSQNDDKEAELLNRFRCDTCQ